VLVLVLVDAWHYPVSGWSTRCGFARQKSRDFGPSDEVLWWSRIWALVVMVELSIRFQLLP
jgi:hypothetical protein